MKEELIQFAVEELIPLRFDKILACPESQADIGPRS